MKPTSMTYMYTELTEQVTNHFTPGLSVIVQSFNLSMHTLLVWQRNSGRICGWTTPDCCTIANVVWCTESDAAWPTHLWYLGCTSTTVSSVWGGTYILKLQIQLQEICKILLSFGVECGPVSNQLKSTCYSSHIFGVEGKCINHNVDLRMWISTPVERMVI